MSGGKIAYKVIFSPVHNTGLKSLEYLAVFHRGCLCAQGLNHGNRHFRGLHAELHAL